MHFLWKGHFELVKKARTENKLQLSRETVSKSVRVIKGGECFSLTFQTSRWKDTPLSHILNNNN